MAVNQSITAINQSINQSYHTTISLQPINHYNQLTITPKQQSITQPIVQPCNNSLIGTFISTLSLFDCLFCFLPCVALRFTLFSIVLPGSGAIEFDEFLESLQTVMSPPSSDDLSQAFAMMDQNGDGFLTKDEIKAGLIKAGEPISDATVEEMLKAADQNNDGKVSYKGLY